MKRATLNFIVDLVAFTALLLLTGTGAILKWVLPPGSCGQGFRGGRDSPSMTHLWGLGRHDWGEIHFLLSILFVGLMLVHLVLHWNWIKCRFRSLLGLSTPSASRSE